MNTKNKAEGGLRVKSTSSFKLKDKAGRSFQVLKLSDFGFIPEVLIIDKVAGESNTLIVRAVMTEEAIKEEDARLAKLKVADKKNGRAKDKPTT